VKNLDSNIGSLNVKLSEDDLWKISEAVSISEVAGPRVYGMMEPFSWRFANTPLPQ
jgi:hypothetical protein